jgi:predicted nucleic acid-binding protein
LSLLDASSIFEALRTLNLKPLEGSSTLDLARYEVGSAIWKHGNLLHTLTPEESKILMEEASRLFSLLDVVDVSGGEVDVLELAGKLKTTFYDASYLHMAKEMRVPLVTEDTRLAEKAHDLGLETRRLTALT